MTARTGRTGNTPSRRSLALGLSLGLHALLWLGICQLQPPNHEAEVREVPPVTGLFLDLSSGAGPKQQHGPGSEEEQNFQVRVDPGLAAGGISSGAGPVVRKRDPGKGGDTPGRGGVGGGKSTHFFGVPAAFGRVVFVVDRSLSMGRRGALDAARRELLDCLRSLPTQTLFQVVLYNLRAEAIPGGMLPVEEHAIQAVESVLARTSPSGATDHEQALLTALALNPEVVFLVTDADDLTPDQLRRLKQANRERVILHAINVGQQPVAGGRLEELARSSGGKCVHVRAPR